MAGKQDGDGSVHQDVSAGGDAYAAGRDLYRIQVSLRPQEAALGALAPSEKTATETQLQITRLLTTAVRAAFTLSDEESKARALSDVVRAAVVAAPERVKWLSAEAEAAARLVDWEPRHSYALMEVARALAPSDPAHAEAIAESTFENCIVVPAVAIAMAAADPERAEAMARQDTHLTLRLDALARIAQAVAAADPLRAAWLGAEVNAAARLVTEPLPARDDALASASRAMAATDPDHAEEIARQIKDHRRRGTALAGVARAVAAASPERAAHLAADIETAMNLVEGERWQARLLGDVTSALAEACPERLTRMAAGFEARISAARLPDAPPDAEPYTPEWWVPINAREDRALALASIAGALGMTGSDHAEAIARSIEDSYSRAAALADIATALARRDPGRAETIALSIDIETTRITALTGIALMLARDTPAGPRA